MPEAWEVQETQSVGDCADCCEECTPEPCDTCGAGEGFSSSLPWCFTIPNFPSPYGGGARVVLQINIAGFGSGEQAAYINGEEFTIPGIINPLTVGFGCASGVASWVLEYRDSGGSQYLSSGGHTYYKCNPLAASWLGAAWSIPTTGTPIYIPVPDLVAYLEDGAC